MVKVLVVDAEKCMGCRTCEMVCSAEHEAVINPIQSRIKIIKWEREGEGFPMACAQCELAPCKKVCPVRAISRDETQGREIIDYGRCIGCRMCVAVCPFGDIHFDSISRKVIKCDLCDGDPLCVKFCQYKALQYTDISEQGSAKQRGTAERLLEFVHRIALAVATGQ